MAYGSPERLDDVPEYYRDIRGGRPIRQELLDDLVERYRRLGIEGASPLNAITEKTRSALERELDDVPVFIGMKHWMPRTRESCRCSQSWCDGPSLYPRKRDAAWRDRCRAGLARVQGLPARGAPAQGRCRRVATFASLDRRGAARRVVPRRPRQRGRAGGSQRLGQDDPAAVDLRNHQADVGATRRGRAGRLTAGARSRVPPRPDGAGERLPERVDPRPQA